MDQRLTYSNLDGSPFLFKLMKMTIYLINGGVKPLFSAIWCLIEHSTCTKEDVVMQNIHLINI